MRRTAIDIPGKVPGLSTAVTVLHFGRPGARPRVHIQAGLHADEVPGMLAAHGLAETLARLEAAGEVRGEIVLVPLANPIGLGQRLFGGAEGRFDLADGVNFNRGYPALADLAAARVAAGLGDDGPANAELIRTALREALATLAAPTPTVALKHALLDLALAADLVLDLHCDGEAEMHLYTHDRTVETFEPLARLLGARAILVAGVSGGEPFDEAVSRPWAELAERFRAHPIPMGSASTTVELRGQRDVSPDFAARDAAAIVGFLEHAGALGGPPPPLPPALAAATPLESCEALEAPVPGILVYRADIGSVVVAGQPIADIVDPTAGSVTTVAAGTGGLFFARATTRFAVAGQRIGKIAGTSLKRSGALLSP